MGNATGSDIVSNTEVGYFVNEGDQYGKEFVVKMFALSVGIYRTDAWSLQLRGFMVTTTASDCTDPFDWSGSKQDWLARIPIGTAPKLFSGLVKATVSDCAVSYDKATLANGSALPSFVTHDLNTQTLTI